jgi:hypothetical protein
MKFGKPFLQLILDYWIGLHWHVWVLDSLHCWLFSVSMLCESLNKALHKVKL